MSGYFSEKTTFYKDFGSPSSQKYGVLITFYHIFRWFSQ